MECGLIGCQAILRERGTDMKDETCLQRRLSFRSTTRS